MSARGVSADTYAELFPNLLTEDRFYTNRQDVGDAQILHELEKGGYSVEKVGSQEYDVSGFNSSEHVDYLEEAGLMFNDPDLTETEKDVLAAMTDRMLETKDGEKPGIGLDTREIADALNLEYSEADDLCDELYMGKSLIQNTPNPDGVEPRYEATPFPAPSPDRVGWYN